jgi:hypothetical protein
MPEIYSLEAGGKLFFEGTMSECQRMILTLPDEAKVKITMKGIYGEFKDRVDIHPTGKVSIL